MFACGRPPAEPSGVGGRRRRSSATPTRPTPNRASEAGSGTAAVPATLRARIEPVENVWEFLRGNLLSHRVWATYDDILEACRDAWNKLMQMPDRIASITRRQWAKYARPVIG